MSVIRQRKKYFIKPGFQSRLTAIMILLVIIVANLVGGLTYLCSHEGLDRLFTDEYKLPIEVNQLTRVLLHAQKNHSTSTSSISAVYP